MRCGVRLAVGVGVGIAIGTVVMTDWWQEKQLLRSDLSTVLRLEIVPILFAIGICIPISIPPLLPEF